MVSSKHIELFEMIQSEIHDLEFKDKYRRDATAFTRRRILDFPSILGSILNRMSKSLSVDQ